MTLDDTGYVHCAYLGTDPSMMVTPAPEARDINYEVSAILFCLFAGMQVIVLMHFFEGGGDGVERSVEGRAGWFSFNHCLNLFIVINPLFLLNPCRTYFYVLQSNKVKCTPLVVPRVQCTANGFNVPKKISNLIS